MQVILDQKEKTTTVKLVGRLLKGKSLRQLQGAVDNLIVLGVKNIVLDLTGLTLIDRRGMSEIFDCYRRATENDIEVSLLVYTSTEEGVTVKLEKLGNVPEECRNDADGILLIG